MKVDENTDISNLSILHIIAIHFVIITCLKKICVPAIFSQKDVQEATYLMSFTVTSMIKEIDSPIALVFALIVENLCLFVTQA